MIAYLPKEKLEFEIREGVKDDKDVLWEMFGENVYRINEEKLGEAKIVVDIGANIGSFSIKACSLAENVRVFAVEPEPHNLELLERNIERNAMKTLITVLPFAIAGEYVTSVELTDQAGSSVSTPSSNGIRAMGLLALMGMLRSEHGIKEVDFLKVDVEGMEYDIFYNLPAERMKHFNFISLEFHATNPTAFGLLVATLSQTHTVDIIGSYDKGGNIYAHKY